jgi:hypothetical protein
MSPRDPARPVYLRLGDWHASETSRNYALGETEPGVSVYDLDSAGQPIVPEESEWAAVDFAERVASNDPAYLVQGDLVGEGHDGEPLLRCLTIVGHWSKPSPS